MKTFKDLQLSQKIQNALDALGFTNPTEIQEKAIPLLMENPKTDVHAQAQTGTGKTLAFGIPLLHLIDPSVKGVQGLIIAPTRELVLQIHESLKEVSRETGIMIEPIFGGMPINRQIDAIRRGAQIIVGTPGRLNDHLRRKTLSLKSLQVLVLDEADIMLDMGFKEEIDEILDLAPKTRQIWLFSATVGGGIKQLITSHMKDVVTLRAADKKGVVSTQVKQYFCVVPMRKRIEATARFIESSPDFYGIIFCQTKLLTSEVTEQLASKGFKINCLHGDMKQTLRNHVIKGFKNKDFNILVATDVAARGIDVSDLTHVINFSLPNEPESYIHRVGRTGRAGKEGIAIVFVAPSEMHKVKRLERFAQTTLQEIPIPRLDTIVNAKMSAVSDFIEQAKNPVNKLSPVYPVLEKLVSSFTDEEVKHAFTVALQDKFFKDISSDIDNISSSSTEGRRKEICMELGRDEGFSENDIRDYLHRTCSLLPQELHKVRVLQNKTFVSIPENRLNDCLDAINKSPISKTARKAYLVEDNYGGESRRDGRRDEGDQGGRRRQGGGGRFGGGRGGGGRGRGGDSRSRGR